MATNPNAIFGEALATGPRQIPLSELQNQIAQTRQTQAQTANIGSQMAQRQQETIGLQQQNTLRQRQLEDEQAVRDTIAKHTTNIPVTAPNANIPTPGTDSDGNPLPLDLGYHQIAAKGAVQAPHVDYNGAYADLVGQGRFAAAETMLRSIQDRRAKDLANSQTQMDVLERQNKRVAEITAGVMKSPPEQQDALASQAGQQLEQEGLIAPGSGAAFTKADAASRYALASGADDPIQRAKATLSLAQAQAKAEAANARKTEAEAGMSEKELDLMNRALSDPGAAVNSVDQLIDPRKYPDINARTKAAFTSAMMFGGPKAAQQVLSSAVTHINSLEENISRETNPDILKARRDSAVAQAVATEKAKAALAPGAVGAIQDPKLQKDALDQQAKAEAAFHQKEGDAQRLQDFVDAARSGNQAAAALIPVAELREIVNRVNRQELQAAGGGVSLARRVENWISSGATGKPTEATLSDIESLGKAVLGAAGTTYKGTVGGINRNMGARFPVEVPVTPRATVAPATGGGGPVTVTTRAAYDALPTGTPYIDSKGNRGVKGQK